MRRLVAGLGALLLCLAGAAGLGPPLGGAQGTVSVIDVSPSCEPLDPLPRDARLCKDSRLGRAIEDAVRAGAKRVRLYTDGCDVSGSAPSASSVPVDVVLRPRRDNIAVLQVRAPDRIPLGTDFAVEIVVGRTRGAQGPAATVAVTLERGGERVGSPVTVELERGATARVLVRDRVDREGVVGYLATVADPVGLKDDDSRGAIARIGDRPLVLSFGGPLDLKGFEVVEVSTRVTAGGGPTFLFADAVVVRSLPDPILQMGLADAVRSGAGLVLMGGRGVAGGPLEKVLPLTDAPPKGRAALLLLDVSGSMNDFMPKLAAAAENLVRHFAPDDQVACLLFTDHPVEEFPWQRAATARFDLRARQGSGNTMLRPALAAAERMLAEARGERRLFVISDGEWGDLKNPELARELEGLGGIHRAALFVKDDVKPDAKLLFPVSLAVTDDLAAALKRLEDSANDRTVASADATTAPAPAWLEGAVPPAGTYRDLVRLYPRRAGETIVLAAGEIPLVGASRPGGKVVMSAPTDVDLLPLVRAVLKDTGGVTLRAWREGDAVVAEASGSKGASFLFNGVEVPARPSAPDRWRATLEPAAGQVQVSCGPASTIVGWTSWELDGLSNRPDIAAAIASSSGGRLLLEEGGRGGEDEGRTVLVFATLLLGALLVIVSAWLRRRP